jgi:hypothetical protein
MTTFIRPLDITGFAFRIGENIPTFNGGLMCDAIGRTWQVAGE